MAFNWMNPLNWLRARQHFVATRIFDSTDRKRRLWAELQARRTGNPDFRLDRTLPAEFSFLVLGDTGEGDSSQFVLVDKLLHEGRDTSFAVIASDVVYPAGRTHSYREKFYVPYRHYGSDIHAIPGNHDWYDELVGFMTHFCDTPRHYASDRVTIDPDKLRALRSIRCNSVYQPNMYFYVDTPLVRIIGIDTGIKGHVDPEQLEWLRRVSKTDKPKILLSGMPIYANGVYNSKLANVDAVVRDESFVLVIAGDTHNFQKYRIRLAEREVWHMVNGGGGAYIRRTDQIPHARDMRFGTSDVRLSSEPEDFECYPTRKQSKRYYGAGFRARLPNWLLDRDQPPYHQSFLRVAVQAHGLRVQLFVVEDFERVWVEAPPYREWLLPYHAKRDSASATVDA